MSEHRPRCFACGNLAAYCPCGTNGTLPTGPPPKTQYQKHREDIIAEATAYSGGNYEPTPEDFVVAALPGGYGGDRGVVWLCRAGCAVTSDPECDYGGWHGAKGHDSSALMIELDDGA